MDHRGINSGHDAQNETQPSLVSCGLAWNGTGCHQCLKRELDRFGVYADYEDRFLDLFKKLD